MDVIGSNIAHYRITAKLGEGGMGEVYRATDDRLNRDVAIKLLPDTVDQDPTRLARFRREAQMLAALTHGNIAQVYGLEEHQGRHAIVLELVEAVLFTSFATATVRGCTGWTSPRSPPPNRFRGPRVRFRLPSRLTKGRPHHLLGVGGGVLPRGTARRFTGHPATDLRDADPGEQR